MPDYLSRQPYLDLLKSIIANQHDNPSGYSFAIDGEWGCGKTWILNELEKQLDNSYLLFHYNTWENDFYDEPLVAILSVMIETLKIYKKSIKEKGTTGKVIISSIATLAKVAGCLVEKKYSINPNDVIDSIKDSGKVISDIKLTKSDFNNMLPLENALKQIKTVITKLSNRHTILFIVDELDRCLPEYAIKVLERLHHICNEMPVIQILAINKRHIADSIATVFGKKYTDDKSISFFADSYLQKFVDTIIPLPNGKIDTKLEVLNGFQKEFESFVRKDLLENDFIQLDDNYLANFISQLFNGIERRTQEKIISLTAMCNNLTINTGIMLEDEHKTYVILIYEIISCICRYVFHQKETCKLAADNKVYYLRFLHDISNTVKNHTPENKKLDNNLYNLLCVSFNYSDQSLNNPLPFDIVDSKTYIMAFFAEKQWSSSDYLRNGLWDYIKQDKVFLQKYDEIMNLLTT